MRGRDRDVDAATQEALLAEGWAIVAELRRLTEGLDRSLDAIISERKGSTDDG